MLANPLESHFFFCFFPFFNEQKLNAENCRTSSASTWYILDPPKFVDTEPLTITVCANLVDSQYHQLRLLFCQVNMPHHMLRKKPQSPAQLVGSLHHSWTKLVAYYIEGKFHLHLVRDRWSAELIQPMWGRDGSVTSWGK
jgi:hypothetical protein